MYFCTVLNGNQYRKWAASVMLTLLTAALAYPIAHQLGHHLHDHEKPHCDVETEHFHSPQLHWEDCQLCPVVFSTHSDLNFQTEKEVVFFVPGTEKIQPKNNKAIKHTGLSAIPRGPPHSAY